MHIELFIQLTRYIKFRTRENDCYALMYEGNKGDSLANVTQKNITSANDSKKSEYPNPKH